jgi:hypothetical protein
MPAAIPSLADDLTARPYSKRPTPVRVIFATASGVIETLEGKVAYQAGDAILTGPAQEAWRMGRDRFNAAYMAVPPTVQGEPGWYRRRPNRILAKQQPQDFEVRTPRGDLLQGKAGDWLVEYAPGDQGIVARDIFAQTYASLDE